MGFQDRKRASGQSSALGAKSGILASEMVLGVEVGYLTSEMRLVRVTLRLMVTVSSGSLTGLHSGS